jgi:hypothetical protein
MILAVLAGCGSQSKPAERSPAQSGSPSRWAAPAESTPTNGQRSPTAALRAPPVNLRTIEWSPQVDREQHLRYHWPVDFKLPVEIRIVPPEVPPEIKGPSPAIKPTS